MVPIPLVQWHEMFSKKVVTMIQQLVFWKTLRTEWQNNLTLKSMDKNLQKYLKFTYCTYPIHSMTWNVFQSSSRDDSTPCTLDNTSKWMTNHFYFDVNGQEFAKVLELLHIVLFLVVQWHEMFSKQVVMMIQQLVLWTTLIMEWQIIHTSILLDKKL